MYSFYLGIDMGGTHVRIITYDEAFCGISNIKKVLFRRTGDPRLEVDENLCELITCEVKKKEQENKVLKGIGLSVAAIFDRADGKILLWPNNKVWNGFHLKEYLMSVFNVPIVMEDDANCAALGERLAGLGNSFGNMVYITISTGVGCGIIINNALYTGTNGWAGELGHIRVVDDGPECSCGMKGCFQSLVSGPAILRSFIERNRGKDQFNAVQLDLKEVADLAHNGNYEAREVFLQAGRYIGKMIAGIVMLLDISVVVIGGGVIEAGEVLLKPIRDTFDTHIKLLNRKVALEKTRLGDNNSAIGSLSLIYSYLNSGKYPEVRNLSKGSE